MVKKPIETITEKQNNILIFIKKYTKEHGYQPKRKDIGKNSGITDVCVTHHIRAMEKKGFVKVHGPCSIEIIKKV